MPDPIPYPAVTEIRDAIISVEEALKDVVRLLDEALSLLRDELAPKEEEEQRDF